MEKSANSDEVLKISVVMATYNGGRYLSEQLDSIVAQTYPMIEIIVQDDGSTDNTLEILEDYARRYPQIKVFANDSGRHGVNGNFFSAMRRAKGDYIAIADQDDIWEKDKLQVQAEAIGDKMLATGFSVPFSSEGFPVKADLRRPNLHLIRNTYLSQVPGHTMLFDRKILDFIDNELTPQTSLIIRLHYQQKLKYREIALQLGISQTAVYKHLSQGIQKLKRKFKNNGQN